MKNIKLLISLVPSKIRIIIARILSLIELVRNLIRPLTISFRLRANVTAGHIIFSIMRIKLLLNLLIETKILIVSLRFFIFYIIFEFLIIIIQATVFTLLFFLYQVDYY